MTRKVKTLKDAQEKIARLERLLKKVCEDGVEYEEKVEREHGELKKKLQQIIEEAKRYSKEAMDFAGYDRISEELEELLK